jgi:hypothetical protein
LAAEQEVDRRHGIAEAQAVANVKAARRAAERKPINGWERRKRTGAMTQAGSIRRR